MGCNWAGIPELTAALDVRAVQTRAAVPGAVQKVMQGVYERSQGLVPVKTGALRASGRVLEPWVDGRDVGADVTYGNAVINYALDQHNTPWYYHPVGQAYYLLQPLLEAVPTAAQTIADDLAWR